MLTNPGGRIAPDDVVGRDALISLLWEALEQQSLRISAERRIGKTTVLNKMKAMPKSGWKVSQRDLEKCHRARDFAEVVHQQVKEFLSPYGQALTHSAPFAVSGPWKTLLDTSMDDLFGAKIQVKFLFLWDEVPYMLQNIQKNEGNAVMVEVLDTLRALHQTYSPLRVVFTGSIGLHHVLPGTTTVNHMLPVEVPPLTPEDAAELARKLLLGERIMPSNLMNVSQSIASESDNFPFYIHHIVRALKTQPQPITTETVCSVVLAHFVDADDPWELRHYDERIPDYYGKDTDIVRNILDILAESNTAASISTLLDKLKRIMPFDDRTRLLKLLTRMSQDHYLERHVNGDYQFRFPLIRRWWKLNRGL